MQLHGYFCSFPCAIAWSERDDRALCTHLDDKRLLALLMTKNYNPEGLTYLQIYTRLRPAPPQTELYLFGGELTLQEFRGKTGTKKPRVWRPEFKLTRDVARTTRISRLFLKKKI